MYRLGFQYYIILILLASSCSPNQEDIKNIQKPSQASIEKQTQTLSNASKTEVDIGPSDYPDNTNPLTGLTVIKKNLLNRRPVAVKISNDPRPMRPQWGLTKADVVYEYYTEWGKTRFIGIFYGDDADVVGPIRSARFFDENIVEMYKSILAYVGADQRVLKYFSKRDYWDRMISEWPAGCPPICRVDPKMWNHAVTNTNILSKHAAKIGIKNIRPNLDGMRFSTLPPNDGKDAYDLSFRFSPYYYGKWVYDYKEQTYIRLQDAHDDLGQGEDYFLLNDRLTGEPVDADNVVALFVHYEYYIKRDDIEIVKMDLLGTGKAILFRDGKSYEVQWQRKSKEDVLTLIDTQGYLFPFKPGRTWFEVIGTSSEIAQPFNGGYHFSFSIP